MGLTISYDEDSPLKDAGSTRFTPFVTRSLAFRTQARNPLSVLPVIPQVPRTVHRSEPGRDLICCRFYARRSRPRIISAARSAGDWAAPSTSPSGAYSLVFTW